jgi:DNA-directed RNA polymerase specialized sigma24 family protein
MIVFAENGWLTGLTLGALVLVIGWLLLRTHRYLARQKGSDSPLVRLARLKQAKQGHHLDAPPEVARWEVQMHETARELSGQLDSKMRVLQALIAEADRAAARLEAAAAKSPEAVEQPAPPDTEPTTQAEVLKSARRRQEEIYTLADYGLDAAEIARRVGSPVGEVELILGLREKK